MAGAFFATWPDLVAAEFEFRQPAFKKPTFNGPRRTAVNTVTPHTRHLEHLNKVRIRLIVRVKA
jgi:hypothetical protein